jgi:hypothetical protein
VSGGALQAPRDTVKAGWPASQSPAVEPHTHRSHALDAVPSRACRSSVAGRPLRVMGAVQRAQARGCMGHRRRASPFSTTGTWDGLRGASPRVTASPSSLAMGNTQHVAKGDRSAAGERGRVRAAHKPDPCGCRPLESGLRSKDLRAVRRGAVGKVPSGNSLAAYPTACPVTTGGMGRHRSAVRPAPTHCGRGTSGASRVGGPVRGGWWSGPRR